MEDLVFGTKQAAEYCQCSQGTIKNALKAKTLKPDVQAEGGKLFVFKRATLDEWQKHRRPAGRPRHQK